MVKKAEGNTVTVQDLLLLLPSVLLAVTVAVPGDTAVITPLLFTVTQPAGFAPLTLHVNDLLSALVGNMVADKVSEAPTAKVVDVLFNVMLDTRIRNTG
jgi:membrane-anchored glycerophosphoryl diester phosphodiesterase (GDPDase)